MAISAEAALLERERELAELEELLAAARAGSGRLLLVEAAAGLGKTRLLREARRRADASGMRVLAARATELERDFPFGVVRQLFEPPLADADQVVRAGLFDGPAAAARPLLDPELSSEPEWADGGRGDPSFATLHGLYWFVANLVESGPALVAVDDAHWADSASLRLPRLPAAAARGPAGPVAPRVAARGAGRRGRAGETAVRSSRSTLVPSSAERRGGGAAGAGDARIRRAACLLLHVP